MDVQVDTREPELVARILSRYYRVKRVKLETGDILGVRVVVERKSLNDLVNSAFQGRLDQQMLALTTFADDHDLLPVLFVHGVLSSVEPYVQKADTLVYGLLSSAVVRYGVHLIWTPTLTDGLEIIARVDRKIVEGKLGQPRKPRVRRRDQSNRQAAVLATLLQIPLSSAREIMGRGGLRWVLNASDEELLRVKGIGPKTLRRIRRMLEGK